MNQLELIQGTRLLPRFHSFCICILPLVLCSLICFTNVTRSIDFPRWPNTVNSQTQEHTFAFGASDEEYKFVGKLKAAHHYLQNGTYLDQV